MWNLVLAALALLSGGLVLWQWWVAWRFPLHRRPELTGFIPNLTVLKPLRGCDGETEACLRSWLGQDYPAELQILFGVEAGDDTAAAVVKRLLQEHPGHHAALVVCAERLGPNGKLTKLAQLERQAKHDVIVVSDADVRVGADFLRNLVLPLEDPHVGLVTCFYRLAGWANVPMRWEAFSVNADFWAQVLQSISLKPMDFALGAVLATTRRQLAAIGGFAVLVDYLADDYELGRRISRQGGRVVLSPMVVECRSSPMSWREVWAHQLRWARTVRICRPGPYFLSILSNGTLWPVVWLAAVPNAGVATVCALCLLGRLTVGLYCERKLTHRWQWDGVWLAPLKDLLQVAVWLGAFAGSGVVWRGERFRVKAEGKLQAC